MRLHGNLNQNEVGRAGPENIKMKQRIIKQPVGVGNHVNWIFLKINLSTGRAHRSFRSLWAK